MVADTFYNRNRIGSEGEMYFKKYLTDRGIPLSYIRDVRKDAFFQKGDIDFLVYNMDGELWKMEIKTDNRLHETGCILWEVKKDSGNTGRLERCQADYVFYYSPVTHQRFLLNLPRTREYVHKMHNLETMHVEKSDVYKLDIKDLTERKLLVEVWLLSLIHYHLSLSSALRG